MGYVKEGYNWKPIAQNGSKIIIYINFFCFFVSLCIPASILKDFRLLKLVRNISVESRILSAIAFSITAFEKFKFPHFETINRHPGHLISQFLWTNDFDTFQRLQTRSFRSLFRTKIMRIFALGTFLQSLLYFDHLKLCPKSYTNIRYINNVISISSIGRSNIKDIFCWIKSNKEAASRV